MNTRKRFTRKQIPGAIILAGGFIWSVYSGNWPGYLIGLGSFYAGAILAIQAMKQSMKCHGRREVRRILAGKPHLTYLVAIRKDLSGAGFRWDQDNEKGK